MGVQIDKCPVAPKTATFLSGRPSFTVVIPRHKQCYDGCLHSRVDPQLPTFSSLAKKKGVPAVVFVVGCLRSDDEGPNEGAVY